MGLSYAFADVRDGAAELDVVAEDVNGDPLRAEGQPALPCIVPGRCHIEEDRRAPDVQLLFRGIHKVPRQRRAAQTEIGPVRPGPVEHPIEVADRPHVVHVELDEDVFLAVEIELVGPPLVPPHRERIVEPLLAGARLGPAVVIRPRLQDAAEVEVRRERPDLRDATTGELGTRLARVPVSADGQAFRLGHGGETHVRGLAARPEGVYCVFADMRDGAAELDVGAEDVNGDPIRAEGQPELPRIRSRRRNIEDERLAPDVQLLFRGIPQVSGQRRSAQTEVGPVRPGPVQHAIDVAGRPHVVDVEHDGDVFLAEQIELVRPPLVPPLVIRIVKPLLAGGRIGPAVVLSPRLQAAVGVEVRRERPDVRAAATTDGAARDCLAGAEGVPLDFTAKRIHRADDVLALWIVAARPRVRRTTI